MRGKDRCKDLYSGMGRQRAEVPPKSRLGHQTGRRMQGRVTGSVVEATRQAGRGRRSRAVPRARTLHSLRLTSSLPAMAVGGRRSASTTGAPASGCCCCGKISPRGGKASAFTHGMGRGGRTAPEPSRGTEPGESRGHPPGRLSTERGGGASPGGGATRSAWGREEVEGRVDL